MKQYCLFLCVVFAGYLPVQTTEDERPYHLDPLPDSVFGKQVRGFSLKELIKKQDQKVINQIYQDVRDHRAIVFRDQGNLTGDEQMNVTSWFGEVNCNQQVHTKSPHKCIYRLGNEKREGLTDRGRRWHVDGSFRNVVDTFVIYHVIVAPHNGPTLYMPLKECADRLTKDRFNDFLRLSYRLDDNVFPVLTVHPYSEDVVFRPHFFSIRDYIWDYGTEDQRITNTNNERNGLHNEMTDHFENTCADIIYAHKWVPGDFIITDNLALAHRAGNGATDRSDKIGLRVIHRSQTIDKKPLRHAIGYVKREQRKETYLKQKEDLETRSGSNTVSEAEWCPVEDEELCGEHGQLIKALRANMEKTKREEL